MFIFILDILLIYIGYKIYSSNKYFIFESNLDLVCRIMGDKITINKLAADGYNSKYFMDPMIAYFKLFKKCNINNKLIVNFIHGYDNKPMKGNKRYYLLGQEFRQRVINGYYSNEY